ncbi:hypothetical protein BGZ80_000555 [Entomortierella chlamydospora]|uniref:Transmembrane protein 198 n=1 Tax=Entomortierella chlamydospora TaxID=101097 RepID=A0A9P6MS97_9FUNG|nr:hypothetical protein BGZ79_000698 [Entomortierella chlamydospora]KAG0011619.1 hypothetical protein BGZ80_000555 [Entomortierella chlamydospora]
MGYFRSGTTTATITTGEKSKTLSTTSPHSQPYSSSRSRSMVVADAYPGLYRSAVSNDTADNNYDEPLILDVGQRTVISSQDKALGTIMMFFGALLVFFGYRLIRVTLLIMGFLTWAVIAVIIMAIVHWDMVSIFFHPAQYYFWMWFLAGLAGALIAFRFWDLGVMFIGGFGGFSLAMGIIAACNTSLSALGRYLVLVILIIFGAVISTYCERVSVIFGTSFSGAFLLMYGLDEFLQQGYREMFAIFGFTGRMLSYHPNKAVYTMIEASLGLACLGIIFELVFHKKPLWMDQKALFSVCGQPFGERPDMLMGQKVTHKIFYSSSSKPEYKTTDEAAYGGGYNNNYNYNYNNDNLGATRGVVGFNSVDQNRHLPSVPEAESNSLSSFATIQGRQGSGKGSGVSGAENISDVETITPGNSGALSKSSSTRTTQTTHTHEEQAGAGAGSVAAVSIQMPVEEENMSRDGNSFENVVIV